MRSIWYPHNKYREKRLRELASQIKESESQIDRLDQQISEIGIPVTNLMKKLNKVAKKVKGRTEEPFKNVQELLEWIQNYSADHDLSNDGLLQANILIFQIGFTIAGALSGFGMVATFAFKGLLDAFFGGIIGLWQRRILRNRTSQALGYRTQFKRNQLRLKDFYKSLKLILGFLQMFFNLAEHYVDVFDKLPDLLDMFLDQSQLVPNIKNLVKNTKFIGDVEVRRVLCQMDKTAVYRDMTVEDDYKNLQRISARKPKTEDQKRIERELEEMNREYLQKMEEIQSQTSVYGQYKQFITGVEKFNYGKLQSNINKSIFAFWGIYDAFEDEENS